MLLQPVKGFSIVHKGFNTISKVFNTKGIIISRVFNIVNKVVAPRSNLVGIGTLSTGYKVLQSTNHLCMGSKALDVRLQGIGCKGTEIIHTCALQEGLGGINDYLWGHPMLASMTIQSAITIPWD